PLSGLATASALTTVGNNVVAILADTDALQTEWADGGRLDLLIDSLVTGQAAIKAKTDLITAGNITVLSAAVTEAGQHLTTVRGDSYTVDSPRGPLDWSPDDDDDWPDLTDATVLFTSRLKSDGSIELAVAG